MPKRKSDALNKAEAPKKQNLGKALSSVKNKGFNLVRKVWSNEKDEMALIAAIQARDVDKVRTILDTTWVNLAVCKPALDLMIASHVFSEAVEGTIIKLLIDNGFDINGFYEVVQEKKTFHPAPIINAIEKSIDTLVNLMSEKPIPRTFVGAVAGKGYPDFLAFLLKNGGEIKPTVYTNPLKEAIQCKAYTNVKTLIAMKADIQTRDSDGMTPLGFAISANLANNECADNCPPVVRALLEAEANVFEPYAIRPRGNSVLETMFHISRTNHHWFGLYHNMIPTAKFILTREALRESNIPEPVINLVNAYTSEKQEALSEATPVLIL